MEKTELFDFSFVDRNREKKIFDNFISKSNKEILWISGKRGVGKSKFIKNMFIQRNQYKFVYYEIKQDSKSEDILASFIQILQKAGDFSFCDFIQKEYKNFYSTLDSATVMVTKLLDANISKIVSVILDVTNYVVTKNGERRETIDVIKKYIERIMKNNQLFICIDNFSMSNEDIIILFCNIFKLFLDDQRCKICIVTTDDDITTEMKLKIQENISATSIEIEEFKEYIYFWQIMDEIFELDDFSADDIKYIFKKCQGKPHNLSIVISKLLEKQGILCDAERKKAIINKCKLLEILKTESIRYNENDFTSFQKIILFSFLCLYDGISIQIVKELAMYISKRNTLFAGFTENKFHEELLLLIEQNKLYSEGVILNTCHDSDYIDYMDIFRRSPLYRIISQNAYEFLQCNKTINTRDALICRHMYEANIEGWKDKNFVYGEKLFQKHLYFDAEKYFSYLLNELDSLNDHQLLLIAINKYQVGYFSFAIKILNKIKIEKLESASQKYNFWFYLGKSIYNYRGDVPDAIEKLIDASKYVLTESEEYVNIQNLLQMFYLELPSKYKNALEIFNNIRDNYKISQPNAWASTMRGCHNFIQDKNAALELLEEAHLCTNDELERAYIGTTKGFVYARSGDLDEAKICFEKAYMAIKEMKRHESSYAANNLAICYMIKDNYSKAKEILLDALFWNRTNYGKIVLYVHLMICETFLGNRLEAEKYLDFLEDYINIKKVQGAVMLRKVYLNLAIASKELGNEILYQSYIKKAKNYVENTSSKWRYQVLEGKEDIPAPKNIYYSYSKFDPWFLVYAHD